MPVMSPPKKKKKKSEADMPYRPAMTEAGSYSYKGWSWKVTEEEAAANRKLAKKNPKLNKRK